ncbi:MAG: Isoquinoline 1-oxidoreductase beta subunit, partial [uncultured Rubellimicrobium sp.]
GGESDRRRTGTGAEPAAAASPGDRAALLLCDRADGGLCPDAASGSGGRDGWGHAVRAGRHDGGGRGDEPPSGPRRAAAGLSLAGPRPVGRGACGRGPCGRGAAACAGRPAGRAEAASGGL